MPTDSINRLTAIDEIVSGDSIPINSLGGGGDRKLTYGELLEALNSDLTFPGSDAKQEFVKQFSTPVTGGTVTITDGSDDDSRRTGNVIKEKRAQWKTRLKPRL